MRKNKNSGLTPALTAHQIKDLLPSFLSSLGKKYQDQPSLVLESWPLVVGEKIAPLTKAVRFDEGILHVAVKNSTLYSLLVQHDKARILAKLRAQLPDVTIKTVSFRLE